MEKSSGCFKCIVMVFYKSGRENGGHREWYINIPAHKTTHHVLVQGRLAKAAIE